MKTKNSQKESLVFYGGCGGNRTLDRWLKRPLLYRLSYAPKKEKNEQKQKRLEKEKTRSDCNK